jgi:hypothetical protein
VQWLTSLLLQFESPVLEQPLSQWLEELVLDAVLQTEALAQIRVVVVVTITTARHQAIIKTIVVTLTVRRQDTIKMVITLMVTIITMAQLKAITMVVHRTTVPLPTSPAPADLTALVNLREVRTPTDPA